VAQVEDFRLTRISRLLIECDYGGGQQVESVDGRDFRSDFFGAQESRCSRGLRAGLSQFGAKRA
jgi:hypothetical protein